LMNTITI